MENVPADNPHMWTPNKGPEPFDEVCGLCGVFSGAHHQQPEPPAASLPCPEPWPEAHEFTAEEMAELERITEANGGPILVQFGGGE